MQAEFDAALAAADRHKARMLLRFMAALVPSNVVHASSVLKAMQSIVDAAKQIAEQGMPAMMLISSFSHWLKGMTISAA